MIACWFKEALLIIQGKPSTYIPQFHPIFRADISDHHPNCNWQNQFLWILLDGNLTTSEHWMKFRIVCRGFSVFEKKYYFKITGNLENLQCLWEKYYFKLTGNIENLPTYTGMRGHLACMWNLTDKRWPGHHWEHSHYHRRMRPVYLVYHHLGSSKHKI